jgi:hypothetical protein
MGGARRYPSTPVRIAMGIASLHPFYGAMRTDSIIFMHDVADFLR